MSKELEAVIGVTLIAVLTLSAILAFVFMR